MLLRVYHPTCWALLCAGVPPAGPQGCWARPRGTCADCRSPGSSACRFRSRCWCRPHTGTAPTARSQHAVNSISWWTRGRWMTCALPRLTHAGRPYVTLPRKSLRALVGSSSTCLQRLSSAFKAAASKAETPALSSQGAACPLLDIHDISGTHRTLLQPGRNWQTGSHHWV